MKAQHVCRRGVWNLDDLHPHQNTSNGSDPDYLIANGETCRTMTRLGCEHGHGFHYAGEYSTRAQYTDARGLGLRSVSSLSRLES